MNKKFYTLLLAAGLLTLPLAACSAQKNSAENMPPMTEPSPQEEENKPTMPELTPESEEEENGPTMPETPPEEPAMAKYIFVRTNGLNVRSGADTSYASLGQVEKGVLLALGEKSGDWYKTQYKNRAAFISANPNYTDIVSLEEGEEVVERVIAEGLKVLGTPYVYGATRLHDGKGGLLKGFTVEKFDCSSLMQYMFYYGAGVNLNMNTRTQVLQGKEIKKADIARGDLLFFTNASRKNNTGIERVGHVALYLGDNYILHTASDYAKVEQISALRWSYFITAKRVL